MKSLKFFRLRRSSDFRADEEAAVTVDWVVLTAAVIVFGLLVWNIIESGVVEAASDIRDAVLSTLY